MRFPGKTDTINILLSLFMNNMTQRLRHCGLFFILPFILLGCGKNEKVQPYVDNIEDARSMLQNERSQVLQDLNNKIVPEKIARVIQLGLWDEAQDYLFQTDTTQNAIRLVQARLFMKKNQYFKAEDRVEAVLANDPTNRQAKLLRAKLYIQSWDLQKADEIAKKLLEANDLGQAGYIRGRVAMFKRDYDTALEWADKVQSWSPDTAAGYLLEAETLFWSKGAAATEPALVKALEADPFNADARFNYGYAIWRRVDATQLDDMAAQWNFALEINPLHYLTHWHFGNGHTNLTYADYAEPSDSVVQALLGEADKLVAQGDLEKAIALTRKIGHEYPKSVKPEMVRGSIFYMYYKMDREARLDSAGSLFRHILQRKQNYGPAHNGLAAVIKQRQFKYLDGFDKLEEAIANTPLPQNDVFYEVFPDLNYYPGQRVAKMVAQQIGPSKAYLPMINAMGRDFQLPPLHHNLAEAMGGSYFLYGTTFDNRQWMDIRGVGSGAAGIEYIERGSHWERNVLAHEYAHLYHGSVLTDKESRRIRALYHAAMANNRTLDYYSANNESEFFAQAYAAYLSDKKVHPLTHKSMNTSVYLQEKDPALYAFVDSLVQKQKAYLAGDKAIMKSNWAQTYVSLARRRNPRVAKAYLDTALNYDSSYIPALLAYADIEARTRDLDAAAGYIAKAKEIDAAYAPIFITQANVVHQKALQNRMSFEECIDKEVTLFEKALKLEHDLSVRSRINSTYRNRMLQYGKVAMAIKIGEQYLEDPPVVSTYLNDSKEQAQVFVKSLYGSLGYASKYLPFFDELIAQNPQNFFYRLEYFDILVEANKWDRAHEILQEGLQILAAANDRRPGYQLRAAAVLVHKGAKEAAENKLSTVDIESLSFNQKGLLTQLYLKLGKTEAAKAVQPSQRSAKLPLQKAQWAYTEGLINLNQAETENAEQMFRSAVKWNPYHLKARSALIDLLNKAGKNDEADNITVAADKLSIPPGPDFKL